MTDRDPRVSYKYERTWDSESDYCAKKAMQRYDEIKRLQLENAELKAALQEQEERSKGCPDCTIVRDGKTLFMGSGMMWGYKFCPRCGRPLKGK